MPNTSDTPLPPAWTDLRAHMRELALLEGAASLLSWDQEVLLPPAGRAWRAEEQALLAGLCHERAVDERIGAWLDACEGDPTVAAHPDAREDVRLLRWDHDRARRLSHDLVMRLSRATSEAKTAWAEARAADDFARFRAPLERIVELCREKAEAYGVPEGGEAWDALAEDYEPGMTAAGAASVLEPLCERLAPLLEALRERGDAVDDTLATRPIPRAAQRAFVERVAAALGFDFGAGRLDESTHPFTSGMGVGDCRLTTRFRDEDVLDALGSTVHEAGHGMYEQGLRPERRGLPTGSSAGLATHESQSRLWENQVARSRPFWTWAWPIAAETLGESVADLDAEAAYRAANRVTPGFIRVEADEVSYHLHIALRFELERAMLRGDLAVADLPDAWRSRFRELFGYEVPDDRRGCLQDIHWSMGAIGYFPTYTLGSLMAAQLFAAAGRELDLEAQIAEGTFAPLLTWLREHVHHKGRALDMDGILRAATGEGLDARFLVEELERRVGGVYGVEAG